MSQVSVGPSTIAGFGVSGAAFASAIAAFAAGDRSEQTVGTVVAGAVGAVVLVATILGRQLQAVAKDRLSEAQVKLEAALVNAPRPLSHGTLSDSLAPALFSPAAGPTSVGADAPDPAGEFPGGGVPVDTDPEEAIRQVEEHQP